MTVNELDSNTPTPLSAEQQQTLAAQIKQWGHDLGFDSVGITGTDLSDHEPHLKQWVDAGMHGEMGYMRKHGTKRSRPAELVPGTKRVVSVRMDYAPADMDQAEDILSDTAIGYISRYALGRDYHKVLRKKLQQLAQKIEASIGKFGYRVFTDSAPVLEKALAEKAGLGWIGKHTNLLDSKTGSWFFIGEVYIDLELPVDTPATNHCGSCQRCLDLCPTRAIVAPYKVDARRCISYLTIELKGAIPHEFRPLIGNRIYGCDDCQLVCPWNKFAETTREDDFTPRATLTDQKLLTLLSWSEAQFLKHTEGTAIRRIGYQSWVRNIAVALGNAQFADDQRHHAIEQLNAKRDSVNAMVQEHIDWAIKRLTASAQPGREPLI